MKTNAQYAKEASRRHTNLNTWAAVVALLEGGLLYGPSEPKVAQRVIDIAKRQIARNFAQHEAALARIR